jgi:predicted nucleic acid-binding protein
MAEKPIYYWDSVVFISYLTGEEPTRVQLVRELLELLAEGAFHLVTSTFTLAEVRYFSSDPKKASSNVREHEDRVDALFASDQIEFRAVTDFIGRAALEMGRAHNQLSPADCVHIATALDVPATVLHTWDGASTKGKRSPDKMLAYDREFGSPPLRIEVPSNPWPPRLGLEIP